ncbi:MAG: neutral/alkaline non-lysosomal ceramidase N-terminal domain-containing protein [candidate division Zixibacteria bacterium]|nr:neutral/alkaline non-lysosomal ceramidase N-terminal domain-containing protein [candidate division Zixibacteria bacterium]
MSRRTLPTPLGRCRMGIGRADITPPVGIYHRNWGAARHDASTGIHRRLMALTLLVDDGGAEHALVTLDLGWLQGRELGMLTRQVADRVDLPPDRVILTFSHTHSAGNFDTDRADQPGGHLIAGYLEALEKAIAETIRAARDSLQPVEIAYGTGRCDFAFNRDYWDDQTGQFVCGTNPDRKADDTVVVARITDANGNAVAHIVNYGCHPTTLAFDNTLISPDYIGAMRETVENHTGVPCLFVLGACGDLGPKDGFVGDTEVADRNGRQLGYAALSALEGLTPPGTEMRYAGPVVSGATLGAWKHESLSPDRQVGVDRIRTAYLTTQLPVVDLPTREEVENRLAEWGAKETDARRDGRLQDAADCRAHVERARRASRRIEGLIPGQPAPYGITLLGIGEGVFVLLSGEPYNWLQQELRARFPGTPLVVAVVCNRGAGGYLPPKDDYGQGLYQESATVLGPGCLEQVVEAISAQLRAWHCK